jgi:hypothetical protein
MPLRPRPNDRDAEQAQRESRSAGEPGERCCCLEGALRHRALRHAAGVIRSGRALIGRCASDALLLDVTLHDMRRHRLLPVRLKKPNAILVRAAERAAKNCNDDHRTDGSISRRPIAAGRSGGKGTDPRWFPVAMVAGAEPAAEALPLPRMVNPIWICPVLSPARAMGEDRMQRTKASRHIFFAPGRDRRSGFATMLCRDGAVFAHHLI